VSPTCRLRRLDQAMHAIVDHHTMIKPPHIGGEMEYSDGCNFGNKQKYFIRLDSEHEDQYFNTSGYNYNLETFINNYVGCKTYSGTVDEIEDILVSEGLSQESFNMFKRCHRNLNNCHIAVFEYQFDKCNKQSPYYNNTPYRRRYQNNFRMHIRNNTIYSEHNYQCYYTFGIVHHGIKRCDRRQSLPSCFARKIRRVTWSV
jgi:hypothetical protein